MLKKKYLDLEDISAYRIASELSDEVYWLVSPWSWFDKRTIGVQFMDATDSIAANVAEGFGRYHKRDKIKFYYNARGSVAEAIHWVKRAAKRKLLTSEEFEHLAAAFEKLPKEINNIIGLTNKYLRN